ncbi:MAG: hypothetical protein WDZ45_00445 [Flavobacteriaceae bacterium]
MNNKRILQFVLVIVTLSILFFINRDKLIFSEEQFFSSLVNDYFQKEFNGVVKDKYIDEFEHMYKKVILNTKNGSEYIFILNFERDDFYEFIQIGDTLIKPKNSLEVNLTRKSLDTTIYFRFDNTRGFINSKVYDSIKDIYW